MQNPAGRVRTERMAAATKSRTMAMSPLTREILPLVKGRPAFRGVMAVGFQIEQIVQDIDARRAEAEADERQDDGLDFGDVRPRVDAEDGDEKQEVLRPLVDAQGLEPFARGRGRHDKGLFHRANRRRFFRERRGAGDYDGVTGDGPNGHVAIFIAGVIKSAAAETLDQFLGLMAASQIGSSVAGDDFIEEINAQGHFAGDVHVGGGDEDELASSFVLLAQILEDRLVQRQRFHVERDVGRELLF